MGSCIRSTFVAIALVTLADTAAAQSRPQEVRTKEYSAPTRSAASKKPAIANAAASRGGRISTLTPEDEARITERLAHADSMAFASDLTAARSTLRDVLREQRRGDAYEATTLRRLANVEFALDRPLVAAALLVELASAAARVADPETELLALVDAAILFAQSGRPMLQRSLVPRMRLLLNSPAISESVRLAVAEHLR